MLASRFKHSAISSLTSRLGDFELLGLSQDAGVKLTNADEIDLVFGSMNVMSWDSGQVVP
jgi:hypothetical protein